MSKTVAEMLRGYDQERNIDCFLATTAGRDHLCNNFNSCRECAKDALSTIADMIEAEQAELRKSINVTDQPHEVNAGVDVDALLKVAEEMEDYFAVPPYKLQRADSRTVRGWANTIRNAVMGVPSWSSLKGILADKEPQLPEGIEWPRYEDGELVKFGDTVDGFVHPIDEIYFAKNSLALSNTDGENIICSYGYRFDRPEPEVLGADNLPIKVGDTVYWTKGGNAKTVKRIVDGFVETEESIARLFPEQLTHRKPDTQEDIDADVDKWPCDYFKERNPAYCGTCDIHEEEDHCCDRVCRVNMNLDLLARQRKLMGGE